MTDMTAIAPKPSVGRIVHYVSYGTPGGEYKSECRAAIVTEVQDWDSPANVAGEIGLCVLNPTGQFFNQDVPCHLGGEDKAGGTNLCDGLDFQGGTWHWPERILG